MNKPIIGVPMGDPAGVGAEIVAKAVTRPTVQEAARVLVIGEREAMERAIRACGLSLKIRCVSSPTEGRYEPGTLDIVDLANLGGGHLEMGKIQGMFGRAAFDYIKKSVELAMAHEIDAVATTPINKESLRAGGVDYIGHTEIFGALTDTNDPLTMFEVDELRVFFLTRHMSLRDACDAITRDRVLSYIERCTRALEQLGVSGTMAVAGLNPHSGEHGLFGWEEVNEISPAVEEARRRGYDVEGPVGPDSVFHQALHGRYKSVLSLYHDQGHIATKTYDFERTIAITLGMPILRTSVDHGTAFDIAGRGIVSDISMAEAIRLAAKYAPYFTVK